MTDRQSSKATHTSQKNIGKNFYAFKGALYIGLGVASPMLLCDKPIAAAIQTTLLVGVGVFHVRRSLST